MKTLSLYISLFLITMVSYGQNSDESQKQKFMTYGDPFEIVEVKTVDQLSALMADSDSLVLTLTGQIEQTCAVKGCWMQLKSESGMPLRVTFKNYSFFVPKTGVAGKSATVQGYCKKQETSVEELRHYAKDAGESEAYIASIVAPKMEYNFVANGVIIRD